MLHSTTAASSTAVVSQPAISAGSHTSRGRSPNSPVSHGGVVTGIQPLFATRKSPATTPSPIIDRMTVAVAIRRSQRNTPESYALGARIACDLLADHIHACLARQPGTSADPRSARGARIACGLLADQIRPRLLLLF